MGTFHGKSYRHFTQHHKPGLGILGPLTGPDIASSRRVAPPKRTSCAVRLRNALSLLMRGGDVMGEGPLSIDAAFLCRQREFSLRTFGPGARTNQILDHIGKESAEIRAAPTDIGEWADVILLALDGAWRTGAEPGQIIVTVIDKHRRNEARTWPNWHNADPDTAIEHVRGNADTFKVSGGELNA